MTKDQSAAQEKLRRAMEHQRRGDSSGAIALFTEIIREFPDHIEALTLLGALKLKGGQAAPAAELFGRVAGIRSDLPLAHSNYGLALRACGRSGDAVASYDKAIALKSDYGIAWFNRGIALEDLGRLEQALESYDRAAACTPRDASVHINRGVVLRALGRPEDALESFERAISHSPTSADAYTNCGATLADLGRRAEAIGSYNKALTANPYHIAALYNRGTLLHQMGRDVEALVDLDLAVSLEPRHFQALNNRGLVLRALDLRERALADYDAALEMAPDFAEALNNRGIVLQELQRNDEALSSFDRALSIEAHTAEAWNNRAHALRGLGRYQEAVENYDRAVTLKPTFADAQLHGGLCRLMLGDFAEGWRQYEWRGHEAPPRPFKKPLWRGEDITGKRILLHAEQGLGDTLQFIRYAAMVAQRGATVALEVPIALARLVRSVEGVDELVVSGEALPEFDVHRPLLSLPGVFRTELGTIPARERYLSPPADVAAAWAAKLTDITSLRVGLVWSGSRSHKNDHNRSLRLPLLAPLIGPSANFISLQKDLRPGEAEELDAWGIHSFSADLHDLADTAGLIDSLDLVISVDTSVAHLAAALGKQTWVMLPFEPDWRWLLDRAESPWYPSVRLFRQPKPGDWQGVVSDVETSLKVLTQRPYVRYPN